jgi:uncharacterized protein (DUF1778 family)
MANNVAPALNPGRAVMALRIGELERRVIEAAAAQRDMPVTRFIREQALAAARRELARGAA